jgi:hypothetical protein
MFIASQTKMKQSMILVLCGAVAAMSNPVHVSEMV